MPRAPANSHVHPGVPPRVAVEPSGILTPRRGAEPHRQQAAPDRERRACAAEGSLARPQSCSDVRAAGGSDAAAARARVSLLTSRSHQSHTPETPQSSERRSQPFPQGSFKMRKSSQYNVRWKPAAGSAPHTIQRGRSTQACVRVSAPSPAADSCAGPLHTVMRAAGHWPPGPRMLSNRGCATPHRVSSTQWRLTIKHVKPRLAHG